VEASNQAVVDKGSLVFIGLRAQDAEETLRSLTFRPGQTVGTRFHPGLASRCREAAPVTCLHASRTNPPAVHHTHSGLSPSVVGAG
jgi:ligand-binding sensor protein